MIWDDLPHTISVYGSSNAADSAGGHATTYTLRDSGVACLLNTASAATQQEFASANIRVSHQIATQYTGTRRGDKVVDASGNSYHVVGIKAQPGVGGIDDFTVLYADQIL